MFLVSRWWLLASTFLLLGAAPPTSQAFLEDKHAMKSAVFLSPKFVLGPGSVMDRYFWNIDFPRGHIAIKEFQAELVDKAGNSIPLHETYLHHWFVKRYFALKDTETQDESEVIQTKIAGICQDKILNEYFGLGSETRHTSNYVPDPYGIEVGIPGENPDGYEERWTLDVHAIDTRGVEDRLGCTECRQDLYNVTFDELGKPISKDYEGGLHCCHDQTQCKLRKGFQGVRRELYMKYTIKWVDWDESIVPVKIYILDVTDNGERRKGDTEVGCQIEYQVEACHAADTNKKGYVDCKKASLSIPQGGDVIYAVAHQHSGGVGATLYGEDGRVICSSIPIYGNGNEAGNEAGYIVGMSTCYPQPGSIRITSGERLTLESNYNCNRKHTGVMGLFYLFVADPPNANPQSSLFSS